VGFGHANLPVKWCSNMLNRKTPSCMASLKLTNSHAIRRQFKCIIGYTEENFLPHHATSFSMKLCHKLFIECFSIIHALPDLLQEEEGLGAHTGVVLLSTSIGVRYFWCHKSVRPCGDKIPLQCPVCYAIRTLKFAGSASGAYNVRCQCGHKMECTAKNSPALYPEGGTGWGKQICYGTEADYQAAWSAPRDKYDTYL